MGADVAVADLDVLTTVRDAQTLRGQWRSRVNRSFVPTDAHRFRSNFTRYDFAVLPVEVMGGLEVVGANGWETVQVDEIVSVNFFGLVMYVPSVTEQLRILKLFGRPKDVQRARLLEPLSRSAPC